MCCVGYHAPALLSSLFLNLRAGAKRFAGRRSGDADAGPDSQQLLQQGEQAESPRGAGAAELRAQLARSADEIARLQALAFSSSNGTSPVSDALANAARAAGSRGGGTAAGQRAAASANAAAFWDRREFLQATAAHCSLLLQLVDEHLVDALAASGAPTAPPNAATNAHPAEVIVLAEAVHSLLSMAAAQAAALVAARRASIAASSMGVSSAPLGSAEAALLEQWASSAPFAAYFRGAMELSWISGGIDFVGAASSVVASWASALSSARGNSPAGAALERELSVGPAGEALRLAVTLHLRLVVWPAVVQSGLAWGVRGRTPAPVALDSSSHVLFSASGRALGEGAAVLFVGPELSGDAELRGRGNRALVFAA